MEWLVPLVDEIVVELLDTRLMGDSGIREPAGARRLGRVLARLAVDQVQPLRLGVVGLEVGVGDGPRGGYPAVVLDLLEVALAQAEQDRRVDLGVAADEVLGVRAERHAVLVVPALGRDIPLAGEDLLGVPVLVGGNTKVYAA